RQRLVGVENLFVGDAIDYATGVIARLDGQLPAGWIADANRGGHGFRVLNDLVFDDRSRARCLESQHPRRSRRAANRAVLKKARPVSRDVASVSDRNRHEVWRIPEEVTDLEGAGLL